MPYSNDFDPLSPIRHSRQHEKFPNLVENNTLDAPLIFDTIPNLLGRERIDSEDFTIKLRYPSIQKNEDYLFDGSDIEVEAIESNLNEYEEIKNLNENNTFQDVDVT